MPKRRVGNNQRWNGPSTWRYLGEFLTDFWFMSSSGSIVCSAETYAYAVGAAAAFFGLPWPDHLTAQKD